jgi:hypothetical protein
MMRPMTTDSTGNSSRKIFGDHRDQAAALREAGFEDEAAASRWAQGLTDTAAPGASEVESIAALRRARPDLTLATATYIARQARTRG